MISAFPHFFCSPHSLGLASAPLACRSQSSLLTDLLLSPTLAQWSGKRRPACEGPQGRLLDMALGDGGEEILKCYRITCTYISILGSIFRVMFKLLRKEKASPFLFFCLHCADGDFPPTAPFQHSPNREQSCRDCLRCASPLYLSTPHQLPALGRGVPSKVSWSLPITGLWS